jgi:hypothetical protein
MVNTHVLVVEPWCHERRICSVNLNTDDPVGARNRAIVFGLVTLVVLGIVLGLSVGLLGSRAVDSTGIDDVQAPNNPAGPPDDPIDDFTATPSPTEETEDTFEPTEPTEPTEPSPTEPTETRDPREPTLNASPDTASDMEQVTLSGRFPGMGAGVTLAVERKEGGTWASFGVPAVTTTTDQGGTFSTWILTGQSGRNLFRLTTSDGESTPTVVVQIT